MLHALSVDCFPAKSCSDRNCELVLDLMSLAGVVDVRRQQYTVRCTQRILPGTVLPGDLTCRIWFEVSHIDFLFSCLLLLVGKLWYLLLGVLAQVTTGERPHVEGVRMYTHDLGVLLTEALRSGAIAAPEASRGSGSATVFPRARSVFHQFCLAGRVHLLSG